MWFTAFDGPGTDAPLGGTKRDPHGLPVPAGPALSLTSEDNDGGVAERGGGESKPKSKPWLSAAIAGLELLSGHVGPWPPVPVAPDSFGTTDGVTAG